MNNDERTRLLNKMDQVDERLTSIDRTLIENTASLKEHMRRTELAEKSIEKLAEDLKPVRRHIHMMEGGLKFLGVCTLVVTLIGSISKLFGLI